MSFVDGLNQFSEHTIANSTDVNENFTILKSVANSTVYPAVSYGASMDTVAIDAAINDTETDSTIKLKSGQWKFLASKSYATGIDFEFEEGAYIDAENRSSLTLSINGRITGNPAHKLFYGDIAVSLPGMDYSDIRWFGASINNVTDDTTAINKAIASLTSGTVTIPYNTKFTRANLVLKTNIKVIDKSEGYEQLITYTNTVVNQSRNAVESVQRKDKLRRISVQGKAESGHYSTYDYSKAFNEVYEIDSAGVSGWVSNNPSFPWLEFWMPHAVVIGDSIAEGHPNVHGRLHSSISGAVNQDSNTGTANLYLASTSDFVAGQEIQIAAGTAREEYAVIQSVQPTYLVLTTNMTYSHTAVQADVVSVIYDPSRVNSLGSLAQTLEQNAKIQVFNHGIGGQNTQQVKDRWNRDVLAQVDNALHPVQTLSRKPVFVVLVAGINDIFQSVASATIIANLKWMIDSAITNNIYPIVFNIGPHALMDSAKLAEVKKVNKWLGFYESQTPKMKLIDFYGYANDTANEGTPKSGVFTDSVHPAKETYQRLAQLISETSFGAENPCVIPMHLCISSANHATTTSGTVNRPIGIVLTAGSRIKEYKIPNSPFVSIPLPELDSYVSYMKLQIVKNEAPTEVSSSGARVGIAELWLSDEAVTVEKSYRGTPKDSFELQKNFAKNIALSNIYDIVNPDNIVALNLFDESGEVSTISDRGFMNHPATLSKNANLLLPSVSGYVDNLSFLASDDYFDYTDHNDFSFDNTGNDKAFSVFSLVNPSTLNSSTFLAKLDATTAAEKAEYTFNGSSAEKLYFYLKDNVNGGRIGRYCDTAYGDDKYQWHSYAGTYSGSKASSGIKIYRDAERVDSNDYNSGTYTCQVNTAAKPGSYNIAADGSKTSLFKGVYGMLLVAKTELTQNQIRQLHRICMGLVG